LCSEQLKLPLLFRSPNFALGAPPLLFGSLDSEPVLNPDDLQLGEELAISYSQVREHRKPREFRNN
jgi:hypothetical protein